MRTYREIRNNIQTLLLQVGLRGNKEENREINKERRKSFIQVVRELKNDYGVSVSLTWLNNLLKTTALTWRQREHKVTNLIQATNIKTENRNYYFHEFHRYGNGEVKRIRAVKSLTFLKV